jgi:hypothetical protein
MVSSKKRVRLRGPAFGLLCAFAVALAMVSGVGAAVPSTYLTTSMALQWELVTTNGVTGFNVTYTNALGSAIAATVFVELINHSGQTVLIEPSTFSFEATGEGSKWATFVGFSELGLPPGNYTAVTFATTTDLVPISVVTQVQVSL